MMVAIAGALPSKSIPILDLLEREGPMTFTQIQKALDLKPSTTDRAMKTLIREMLAFAQMMPTAAGRGYFLYRISDRGEAVVRSVRAYRQALAREADRIGDLVDRLDPLAA